jgi:hypothetical protein
VLLNFWKKGSFGPVLNAFNMNKDPPIIMDMINETFAQGRKMEMLNYDYIH